MTKLVTLPTPYQQFIHLSRYSRWNEERGRRESWDETVDRYLNFFDEYTGGRIHDVLFNIVRPKILNLEVMPSMRAMMTAGEALKRENLAGYNCSALAVNNKRSFSEALYILMCFHPDTLVKCKTGDKKISDVVAGDEVLSFDEEKNSFVWKESSSSFSTNSSSRAKVEVEFEDGKKVLCTADHRWLTSNRGWVEAQHLTSDDDLVAAEYEIYRHTSKTTGKSYIGVTRIGMERRFSQHVQLSGRHKQVAKSAFHDAIRKYGKDNWVSSVLQYSPSSKEAYALEKKAIEEYCTFKDGYNLNQGGRGFTKLPSSRKVGTYKRTQSHRDSLRKTLLEKSVPKINETRKTTEYRERCRVNNLGERNPQFGKTHSEEWKSTLSERMVGENNPFFGKTHTEETKRLLSEKQKAKSLLKDNPFKGKRHTEETKQKMKAYWAKRRTVGEAA